MGYLAAIVGTWAVTRGGRKLVAYMPHGSKRRRVLSVLFGGGGPGTPN